MEHVIRLWVDEAEIQTGEDKHHTIELPFPVCVFWQEGGTVTTKDIAMLEVIANNDRDMMVGTAAIINEQLAEILGGTTE